MPIKNNPIKREAARLRMAKWRSIPENLSKLKARRKKAYHENINGLRDKMKSYYEANKEWLIPKQKDYQNENPQVGIKSRQNRKLHNIHRGKNARQNLSDSYVASLILTTERKKLKAAAQRKYIANNKDKIRAWQKQYRSKPGVRRRMNEARKKRMQDPVFREKRLKQKGDHQKRYAEKYNVLNNNWKDRNKERVLERAKGYNKKSIETIDDKYVRILIRQKQKNKIKDIPADLIELKRAQIILQREIKKQNENTK